MARFAPDSDSDSDYNNYSNSRAFTDNSAATPQPQPLAAVIPQTPLVSSYNEKIRPLLDAVDKLRDLRVMTEGIQLPTIVVVGDQSSGKSSVLESLAGISLPRGQGICTRVPLIMRLQSDPNPEAQAQLHLEYDGKTEQTDEDNVARSIVSATSEIAGGGKGIANRPLTLVVKKHGVPDLTMVDLPGITRVPVHGQPENIYEQISEMIMEYIRPEESIILNVLSASVDFSTCESIRMSQIVDKTGQRTLAVVTKADKAPEGLLEKVTADDVNIGLGYVCVRNRINDETYEEARKAEEELFRTHPLLCKIDKSIVGVSVLAQRLMQIQATIVAKCLPEIVAKINNKLGANISKLSKMPKHLSTLAEATTALMEIVASAKESLRKILLSGEYDEYPDEENMHCVARFVEMLNEFSNELPKCCGANDSVNDFLREEIKVLEEARGIGLPNFLPRTAFLTVLQKRVREISSKPGEFVERVWNFLENVVIAVLLRHSDNYPQLQSSIRRAARELMGKMKEKSVEWVIELVEMEKLTDYTCNSDYMLEWNNLMTKQEEFIRVVNEGIRDGHSTGKVDGIGEFDISFLSQHMDQLQQAFDLKMRLRAYWKIVLMRLVDSMALRLQFNVQNLVNKELGKEILNELMGPNGGGLERMLEESPSVAVKRARLKRSIELLKESKDVVGKIMDKVIVASGSEI